MTDRGQQISELHERRQFYYRISDLQSNCEKLKNLREKLRTRLSELNEAVDKLNDERSRDRHDSNPKPYVVQSASQQAIYQNFASKLATNDLSDKYKFSSPHHQQEPIGSSQTYPPSDAFKMKLSHCLYEVVEKAEEIVDLSEHLASRNDTFYDQTIE